MRASPGRSRDTEHRLAWTLWAWQVKILRPKQAERMRGLLLPQGQRWDPRGPWAGAADRQTD